MCDGLESSRLPLDYSTLMYCDELASSKAFRSQALYASLSTVFGPKILFLAQTKVRSTGLGINQWFIDQNQDMLTFSLPSQFNQLNPSPRWSITFFQRCHCLSGQGFNMSQCVALCCLWDIEKTSGLKTGRENIKRTHK